LLVAVPRIGNEIYKFWAQCCSLLLLLTGTSPCLPNHESCCHFTPHCTLFIITVSLTG